MFLKDLQVSLKRDFQQSVAWVHQKDWHPRKSCHAGVLSVWGVDLCCQLVAAK